MSSKATQWSLRVKDHKKMVGKKKYHEGQAQPNAYWEPQDVRLWEASRNPQHTQNTWWLMNQPDVTSYMQLHPRKFQDQ